MLVSIVVGVFIPLAWAQVNSNADELRVLVAEGMGTDAEQERRWRRRSMELTTADVEVKGEGNEQASGDGGGGGGIDKKLAAGAREAQELWTATERTQFLLYLSSVSDELCFVGIPVRPAFVLEFCVFFASWAFLFWQATALSGWSGFSFDQHHNDPL